MKFENRLKVENIVTKARGIFFKDLLVGDIISVCHYTNMHPYRSTSPRYMVTNKRTLNSEVINRHQLESGLYHFDFSNI